MNEIQMEKHYLSDGEKEKSSFSIVVMKERY